MNHHEIEKARRCLRTAGTVEDRAHVRQAAMARLKDEIEVTAQRKEAIKKDFHERLEKWETRTVRENAPVVARPGDRHDSRLYRLTGWIALLSETGLAAWIFLRLHVPAWIGALTALGVTFTLHGVFLFACESEDRPKVTVDRIKRYAAIPAIIGFLIALAGGALARYVTGNLAYLLLPLFSFSLWLGTLSLIVLAASLFTIAHLRGWASRHENEYHRLDSDERASASFLRELLQEEQRTAEPGQMRKPTLLLPEAVSQGKHTISAVILLAAVLFVNSGCAGLASDEAADIDTATQSQASVEPQESGADLHVFIDWSGSCVRPALDEAWATVKSELPAIVEQHRIGPLTIWSFDTDGWCPKRIASEQLPVLTVGEHPKIDGGEWESFSNIRDAVRRQEAQEWEKRKGAAMQQYRQKLQEALSHMDSVSALPDPKYETPRSDPVGLLERIAATHDQRAQYFIVLTDMADTQRKVFPKLDKAKSEVHALVLIIPAKPSDAILTLGKPLSGPEQFQVRVRQIGEMAPWISAAPYFARNIAELLKARE